MTTMIILHSLIPVKDRKGRKNQVSCQIVWNLKVHGESAWNLKVHGELTPSCRNFEIEMRRNACQKLLKYEMCTAVNLHSHFAVEFQEPGSRKPKTESAKIRT